tara:strand:- start:898 stop:1119 length:222 start_codon:yes stop_codon:yes gene_type:complete
MKNLKLYVWEGVLTDYTDGCMFALAKNVEEARKVILDKSEKEDEYMSKILQRDLASEPKVIDNPKGFYVWGGG